MSEASIEKEPVTVKAEPTEDGLNLVLDPAEEKKYLRKLDFCIISILGWLYLLAFLDRGNIGNANVAGLSKDIHLVGNQYGTLVSIVYATYVVFEPIYTVLLKIVTPRILLSVSTLTWGVLTISTAFVKNYHDFLAIRLLLGMTEAGLFPCLNIYLAMWYKPHELGKRLSYIFGCAALSGAFGGLLAYGLTQITPSGGLNYSWQYLYIIEGVISCCFTPIAYFGIANDLRTAWYLNAREREIAVIRYEQNKLNFDNEEEFTWAAMKAAALDWHTWMHSVIQYCADTSLYAVSTFMPIIISGLKITHRTVDSQLLTVPVYFVGAASFFISGRLSDRYRNRSVPLMIHGVIGCIGYVIVAVVGSAKVRYFGLFVVALSFYAMSGTNVAWTNNSNAPHYKRALATGLMQLIGNSAGAAIGYQFSANTAPAYHKGLWSSFALTALLVILCFILGQAYRRENARRDKLVAQGAPAQPELGDKCPHYRYYT